MAKGYKIPEEESFPKKGEVYKHYKGDLYEIEGVALHSNDDIWMVVYKPLYENRDAEMFTRPLSEWREMVKWKGKEVIRFVITNN